VFSFGAARYFGASGGNGPVMDAIGTASGQGYTTVASNGAMRDFGDARWFGDAEHFIKRRPMVAIAG
jgi:hypothetical protein